ncbi:tubulin-specific chaperone cofactor E-like protein [Drosophila guanche]|uniref:Blast:Tubulin-specific chaperone cofactor E-like protein n=1 Tax=Drosophila guanche TaxID=7266 RepID=A0A3B0JSJ4_DROGU|nr:tubulin-specific chaperone cofactor E-like protein [Drosophila guanche]XP_034120500.1 tubulin-specific chaperone cofactor E-like protein [Drosophila guanche]SPP74078.1 blast:Tubulin-specific chaperone cofactor E-like protein [Drosophila guanche]
MPSLLEALERKYFAECEFENAHEPELHKRADLPNDFTVTKCGGRMEFSIFIPRLSPLTSVPALLVLNDCDIDSAGDFESIREKCQRVRELDLAQNKLSDWQEVFNILKHMPRIEFLNLSKNQLGSPIGPLAEAPAINLKSLVLNGTYLDWQCVDTLLQNLPVLQELHLSLNNYRNVLIDAEEAERRLQEDGGAGGQCDCQKEERRITKAHPALKTLHFTGNPVEHWQEICRLGRLFPNLEALVLADCPIRSLQVAESQECDSHKFFPSLKLLNLSSAQLNCWSAIDELAKFQQLQNLRVKHWPLWESLECTEHERRQLLIARLPNVEMLNGGGKIGKDERIDAERAFVRHYMDKSESERPARYEELLKVHGKLDPLVDVSLKPDKRIKVIFNYGEMRESRFVDIYLTVNDLKAKLEKLVNLPPNKMRLFYLDQDYKEFGPEEMRFPNKKLYSYNIQSGDEIIIDAKK